LTIVSEPLTTIVPLDEDVAVGEDEEVEVGETAGVDGPLEQDVSRRMMTRGMARIDRFRFIAVHLLFLHLRKTRLKEH
jgi:hypothetical protein